MVKNEFTVKNEGEKPDIRSDYMPLLTTSASHDIMLVKSCIPY